MHTEILKTFEKLTRGYKHRDLDKIDEFMEIFCRDNDAQMIGIGATKPGEYEWFTGFDEIKEIIISDWKYWGNVHFDIEKIRITQKGDVAWFSLCANVEQTEMLEETWEFFESKMKELFDDKSKSAHDRMFEAAHYGIRRAREKNCGVGHPWPAVITGVLVKEDIWKFHTLHWAMPVD